MARAKVLARADLGRRLGAAITRILTSSFYLDLSGTPTYTRTLKRELERRGHEVCIYSPMGGEMAVELGAVDSLSNLVKPDVVIAHQNMCAEDIRNRWRDVPIVFSAHGVIPKHEQPPKCDVQAYTAINEDVRLNLMSYGIDQSQIEIVRDFVDTEIFRPYVPANDILTRVLFISNFKKGDTYPIVVQACEKAHVHLAAIGAPYGRSRHVESDINEADLVISTARGVLEAMSCARPVISFGQMRGDGYLKPEVYMRSRTRNFAGEKCACSFDAHQLAREMGHYSPVDGQINRMLVLEHHDVKRGVDKLLEIIHRIV